MSVRVVWWPRLYLRSHSLALCAPGTSAFLQIPGHSRQGPAASTPLPMAPPLPGLLSPTAPPFIWWHHLTQQTPALTLLPQGRLVTSRYGRSLALWLYSTDCNIRLYIRWLIHICIHSYLTNTRAGATAISLPTIPPVLPAEPSTNRCSRNAFINPAHIAWVMNTWQKPDEVLGKLEMTVYEYWPSSWTHMKTVTSNYLVSLGKSWAGIRIDHMY